MKFEEYITYVIRESDFMDKLNDLYDEYNDIIVDGDAPLPSGGEKIVDLIETIMNLPKDGFGYSTLSWWLYECDFGRNKDLLDSFELTSLPEDHRYRHPKLYTIRDLYDFLLWEGSNNKDGEVRA